MPDHARTHVRSTRAVRRPAAWAERLWRGPLALGVAGFAACGPAQSLGLTRLVELMSLGSLAACLIAVPLGLIGLRAEVSR